MTLTFKCDKCHEPIVVKYLQVGEKAKCRNCGAEVIVPVNVAKSDGEPNSLIGNSIPANVPSQFYGAPDQSFEFRGKEAWNPLLAFWIGFLFGLLPGGIMFAFNYRKFGEKNKAWQTLIIIIPAFLLTVGLAISQPHISSAAGLGTIDLIICHLYYQDQKRYFENFIRKGGERKGLNYPILMVIGMFLMIFGIAVGFQYRMLHARLADYQEGIKLAENGKIPAARLIFEKLISSDSTDNLGHVGMSAIYVADNHIDSARMELRMALFLDSTDINVQHIWTNMVEQFDYHEDGPVTLWHDNGQKKVERYYKDGRLNGKEITWYPNGKVHSVIFYKDGLENGEVQLWYQNGNKMGQGIYKLGKKEGRFINWDEKGTMSSDENYADGILIKGSK